MKNAIGLELEMPVIRSTDGRSHAVTRYFEVLDRLKRARGQMPAQRWIGGRLAGLGTIEGESGLDNGFNLLETAFAPVPEEPGVLDNLANRVVTELEEAQQALSEEGATLLNASEHPDCTLDAIWYESVRVQRPIYRELVDHRGWLHHVGIDAKAQNSPCTGVAVDQAVRGLNAILALAPAFIAIFANSPLEGGRETGLKENRLTMWDRMFRCARFPGDHFLQRLPRRPFRDLGDHYRWMYGVGTSCRALPSADEDSYKNASPVFLRGDPPLSRFLHAKDWIGVLPERGKCVQVRPRARHFVYAQFAHFLDARWRYHLATEPDLQDLLYAWNRPDGIEELLVQCGAVGYIEGRAPGAVFADAQLIAEAGEVVSASAPLAPSAMQLGLMRNLKAAQDLWCDWGWDRLRSLRDVAIRSALDDDDVLALARETLDVARGGLKADEQRWLSYANHAVQCRRTGSDRLLALWRDHDGRADRLTRVCAMREVHAISMPTGV